MVIRQGDWEETSNVTPYYKPSEGDNIFRIVSSPVLTLTHWIKVGANSKLLKVSCADKKDSCPLCKFGAQLLRRQAFFVLDRKDGNVKVYEAPSQVYQTIKANALDEDYGNPQTYDIKLKKTGSGLKTEYTVLASPKKKPLTEEEEAKVASFVNSVDWDKLYPQKTLAELESLVENLSPDFIDEVREKQAEKAKKANSKGDNSAAPQEPAMASVAPTPQKTAQTQTDEEEFFGSIPEKESFSSDELDWEAN